jgi:hypothetical protein
VRDLAVMMGCATRSRGPGTGGAHGARIHNTVRNRRFRDWRGPERSMPPRVGDAMDAQTKREFWILAIGTALVEAPAAMIAYAILSH